MNGSVNSGRAEAPGHSNSPGVQHSSTAEIASQQLKELILHVGSPLFVLTHYVDWYIWIIALYSYYVNSIFYFFHVSFSLLHKYGFAVERGHPAVSPCESRNLICNLPDMYNVPVANLKKKKHIEGSNTSEKNFFKSADPYVKFYNETCPHQTLKYQTPPAFEDNHYSGIEKAVSKTRLFVNILICH